MDSEYIVVHKGMLIRSLVGLIKTTYADHCSVLCNSSRSDIRKEVELVVNDADPYSLPEYELEREMVMRITDAMDKLRFGKTKIKTVDW